MNKETEMMPFHREDVRGSASLKIFFKKTHLVPLRHQAPDMHKQAVGGDAARHEAVIRVAEDVQLLGGNLRAEG